MNNYQKFSLILVLTMVFVLLPELVFAKDVVVALRQTENKAREIFMTLGPLSLILAGVAFQFSKQLGGTLLLGSVLGIAIFAGRHGIFDLFFGIFS